MNRVYHKYTEWEDFKNGMYDSDCGNYNELLNDAILLLSNSNLFYETALKVIEQWIVSTKENLTNLNSNRRAWIGQASCCMAYGVPESITRDAWAILTDVQRYNANKVADKIISIYENKNRKIHSRMGNEML